MKSFYSVLIVAIMIAFSGCTGASDENPTITLKGDSSITLAVGQFIRDPGYTASDAKDGDLTSLVEVSGIVNYYQVGQYIVNYSVKDSDGYEATASRTVNITENGAISGQYSGFDDSQLGESYDFAMYNYNALVRDEGKTVKQTVREYRSDGTETMVDVVFERNNEKLVIYEFNDNKIANTDYIGFDKIQSKSGGVSTIFTRNIRINETFVDETRDGVRMTCALKDRAMMFNTADITGSNVPTFFYSDVLHIQCPRSDGLTLDSYFANGWGEVLTVTQFNNTNEYSVLDKNSMQEVGQ